MATLREWLQDRNYFLEEREKAAASAGNYIDAFKYAEWRQENNILWDTLNRSGALDLEKK